MKAFAHIIVEERHGHWSAWMSDFPDVMVPGDDSTEAILQLLDVFEGQIVADQITAIDEAKRDGHLEFRIPRREPRQTNTKPSLN